MKNEIRNISIGWFRNTVGGGLTSFSFFLVLLLAVFARSAFSRSNSINGYVKKEILFLKWGSGDYEIGLKAINHGPTAMAVDKNENIYITDPWNKRIQVFSIKGKLLKSEPLDAIGPPVDVDDDGDIFTTYSTDGNRTRKLLLIKKNGERIKGTQGFGTIRDNKLYDYHGKHFFSFDSSVGKFTNTKFNEPLFFKEDMEKSINENGGGNGFLIIKTEKIKNAIQKYGKTVSADSVKIPIVMKKHYWPDWRVLGFDNTGNVYFAIDYSRLGGDEHIDPKIQIYSINGNLEMEIPLDIDFCLGGWIDPDFLKVDALGNIYQLHNTESGVYVYKWSKD